MKNEIRSATDFLSNLLRSQSVATETVDRFRVRLQNMLCSHYQNHWFPESPNKGSGYRCIRINHKMDPILKQVAVECGIEEESLRNLLPRELTMWVDPREVAYRIGENGSIGMLYESDLPHIVSQKHEKLKSQQQSQTRQFQSQTQTQADLDFNTLGYSCKGQLMNVLPNGSRDMNGLKHLAAFVYS